jgi:hypothetical protein
MLVTRWQFFSVLCIVFSNWGRLFETSLIGHQKQGMRSRRCGGLYREALGIH